MPYGRIRQTLESFVRDRRSEVLVLKGRWGTGKTHLWNEIVHQNKSTFGHKKYAYVSLFGVDSVEDVKNAIVIGMARADSSRGEKVDEIMRGLKSLVTQAGKIPITAEWGGALAGALAFFGVKDALVCFDDLERRGPNLTISQVLGLASLLKDQRGCSVAIILNEDSLDESEISEFRQHGEKLADIDLKFARDLEDALNIGLRQDIPYRDQAYERCSALGIDNIRILRRIGRLIEGAGDILGRCEPALAEELISSLILFVWCYYDESGDSPPLSFVKQRSLDSAFGLNGRKLTEEQGEWVSLLEGYGYRYTDALDLSLIGYVEKGYLVDVDATLAEVEVRNREIQDAKVNSSYFEIWKLFTDSFADNEDELVDKLISFARDHMDKMAPRKINEVVVHLRALERGDEADRLIELFVSRLREGGLPDFSGEPYARDVTDEQLRSRLGEVRDARAEKRDLGDVIKRISRSRSWHSDDIALLASKDIDDYVQFFRGEQSDELPALVRTCLGYLKHSGEERLVGVNAREALRKLSAESKINRLRVINLYGITSDDLEKPK